MTKKTTLHTLRKLIGLNRPELAKLIKYSVPAIEKVEYGGTAPTVEMATVIAWKTGISSRWLMENDTSKPPVDRFSAQPFTKETFAKLKEKMLQNDQTGAAADQCLLDMGLCIVNIGRAMLAGYRKGQPDIVSLRISHVLNEIQKEFCDPNMDDDYAEIFSTKPTDAPQAMLKWFSRRLEIVKQERVALAAAKAWGKQQGPARASGKKPKS